MRDLTSSQDIERQKTGKSVVWVLEIDFPSPAGTQYFAFREITISGNLYSDKFQRFSDGGKVFPVAFDPNDAIGVVSNAQFIIRNLPEDVDRFSDLISEFGLDGFEVRFGLVFLPPGSTPVWDDIIWYHTYLVDNFTILTQTVQIVGVDISEFLLDRFFVKSISANDYPLAPEESFNKSLPIIFGAVTECPAIPVVVGARTLLDGSLLIGETIISVADVRDFPDPGAGGYQVQIGSERILVRAIDRDNKTLGTVGSPCERGYGVTNPDGYIDGTSVHEIKASYIYLLADHKLKSVSNVRVGEHPIASGWIAYYDEDAGRHYLNFSDRPISIIPGPGSAVIRIDGGVDEDGVTPVWHWKVNGDSEAKDSDLAYDVDGLFTFALLDKSHKILSIRNQDILSDGGSRFGRFKKLRLGVEYFCSGRWGNETWPYFWVLRNDVGIKGVQYLQRPAREDEKIQNDDHDHQEKSDWTIGDSTGLFEVEIETDIDLKNDIESTGWFEQGQFWAQHRFTGLEKSDGAYKILTLRWYVLFDGFPTSAILKITLANNQIYQKSFTEFAVPEEKYIELKVENVGEILFQDIIEGKVIFRVEGTYNAANYVTIDGRIEVESKLWMKGQEEALSQTQDQNRTELIDLLGTGATSRVTQMIDYSVAAREYGGWGFFNGAVDFKLWFNNPSLNDDAEIYILNVFFEVEYQPLVEEFASGEVLVDVEGFETYPGEEYYDNPVDILRYLLMGYYGNIDEKYIDDGSFDAVRASVGAIAPSVGRWLAEKRNLKEVVQSLLLDINCVLIFEGLKYYLIERKENLNLTDSVLEITDEVFSETSIAKERSSLMQIFNQIGIYYNRRPGKDWFRRELDRDDLISQDERWSVRRETYNSWWHSINKAAVNWIGAIALAWNAWKYNVSRITAPLNLIHLARTDTVQLTHERSGLNGQVSQVAGTRIVGPDTMELTLAFKDALRIFQTANCRVEVDQSSGGWMKFYSMGELLAILYDNGDFHFKYKFNMAGTAMLKGNDPAEGELFVCHFLGGTTYGVAIPLPQTVGQCWLPMIVIGFVGVVRLFGARLRTGVASMSETISNYVEWSEDEWVKIAPNGRDVVAKFEAVTDEEDPDFPGVWTFKGDLKERAFK